MIDKLKQVSKLLNYGRKKVAVTRLVCHNEIELGGCHVTQKIDDSAPSLCDCRSPNRRAITDMTSPHLPGRCGEQQAKMPRHVTVVLASRVHLKHNSGCGISAFQTCAMTAPTSANRKLDTANQRHVCSTWAPPSGCGQ